MTDTRKQDKGTGWIRREDRSERGRKLPEIYTNQFAMAHPDAKRHLEVFTAPHLHLIVVQSCDEANIFIEMFCISAEIVVCAMGCCKHSPTS